MTTNRDEPANEDEYARQPEGISATAGRGGAFSFLAQNGRSQEQLHLQLRHAFDEDSQRWPGMACPKSVRESSFSMLAFYYHRVWACKEFVEREIRGYCGDLLLISSNLFTVTPHPNVVIPFVEVKILPIHLNLTALEVGGL